MIVLVVGLSVVAQLFIVSLRAQDSARVQSMTTILANQKVEELRGLVWTVDEDGRPLSDWTSNLSVQPPTADGSGLSASSPNTLDVNTPGYVDYLDAHGVWVGTGSSPPRTARYIRRWCIQSLPTDPDNIVILRVLVTTLTTDLHATKPRRRLGEDALVETMRARKAH